MAPADGAADARLLIINNVPAYYRTAPFARLVQEFERRTGGQALVAYQARRNGAARGEWFFTPDDDFPYDPVFVTQDVRATRTPLKYSPRGSSSLLWNYRPTHIFAAGWDTPLTLAAAAYTRVHRQVRMGAWVESNHSTTRWSNRFARRYRQLFLETADFVVVPTEASEQYVDDLRRTKAHAVHTLNPVIWERLPDDLESTTHRPRAVFLGDLSRRKGIDRVFELAHSAPDIDFEVWGRDTEELASTGDRIMNLRIHGPVTLSDIVPRLRSTDVLLIPSRVDPAPLTYSEGLALGLRMVVSDSIAYRHHATATEGVTTFDGTPQGFRTALAEVLRHDRPPVGASLEVTPQYWARAVADALLPVSR